MAPDTPRPTLLAALVATLLVLAGCSGSSSQGGAAPAPASQAPAAPTPALHVHATTVPSLHPSVDDYPEAVIDLVAPDTDTRERLAVKVADTPQRRQHGLMEVTDLPTGAGMWFQFREDHMGGFWMAGTLVPLDIAFADAGGTINDVLRMTPCEEADTSQCPVYEPDHAYRTALEVPAGWFGEVGVTPGWRIEPTGD